MTSNGSPKSVADLSREDSLRERRIAAWHSTSVTISKTGGSFASPAGALANITGNFYKLSLTTGDTDTLGCLAYKFVDTVIGVTIPNGDGVDQVNANATAGTIGALLNDGSATVSIQQLTGNLVGNITGNITGNLSGSVGTIAGQTLANLDAAISSRLATSGYTAPLTAATTRTALGIASANLDTQLAALAPASTALSTAQWTNALATLLGNLTFTVANKVDANILAVNSVTVAGTGASGNEWGPG